MKYFNRFCVIACVVAVGLAIQGLLYAHLSSAPTIPPGSLTAPLETFPKTVGSWQSVEMEIPEDHKYASQHLSRAYVQGQPTAGGEFKVEERLDLWMVFSEVGEDRKHHPEVCFQTAGQREMAAERELIEVEGHPSPVQQMRFTDGEKSQYVYYWHYTIPSQSVEKLTTLQKEYQKARNQRASITLQVFAHEMSAESRAKAIEFVKLVDAEIQPFVGPDAIRKCNRLPVTLIEGPAPEEH